MGTVIRKNYIPEMACRLKRGSDADLFLCVVSVVVYVTDVINDNDLRDQVLLGVGARPRVSCLGFLRKKWGFTVYCATSSMGELCFLGASSRWIEKGEYII